MKTKKPESVAKRMTSREIGKWLRNAEKDLKERKEVPKSKPLDPKLEFGTPKNG